jgi:3'-phosphoadenosine 5'-phosphosulfate sulfotransferase (PAPS reductase)/FAD synthetase
LKSEYFFTDNTCISFSGGRTSGYMLKRVLDAHGGTLPDHVKVCFANTGREMPETLDFVRDCGEHWGVDIVWLELGVAKAIQVKEGQRKKYEYQTKVVSYETASRNGEPFMALVKARSYLPNPVARFCTADLKVRRINKYLKSLGWDEWDTAVGIRADEARRAAKIFAGGSDSGEEKILPLYHDKCTKETIFEFWQNQGFDLKLPNNNGTTDWGNCDLCFLKGSKKKLSIIEQRPDLADWWIEAEKEIGSTFRNDHPSYAKMKQIASDQGGFDFGDDSLAFCGCTD